MLQVEAGEVCFVVFPVSGQFHSLCILLAMPQRLHAAGLIYAPGRSPVLPRLQLALALCFD